MSTVEEPGEDAVISPLDQRHDPRQGDQSKVENTHPVTTEGDKEASKTDLGWQFWAVFPALCIAALIASLEATVVTTALPTINSALNTGANYVWVINVFFLTSAAFQPLYGQFANAFGRRWVMSFAIVLFMVGSAIGGSANSVGQLIAGRAVQGSGGGGLVMMLDMIVSDLVPVRQRASFMSIIFAAVNVGTAIGPFVGGEIVQHISWRWVFYINIPIGGFALVMVVLCLNTNYRRDLVASRVRNIDYVGNAILIASTLSILYALTYGNVRYSWGSWHIIVPFLLGFFGFGVFVAFEASPFPRVPVMPLRMFHRRTSVAVWIITFIWSILSMWRVYFLSVYFQAVKLSSPTRAGVQLLPSLVTLFLSVTVSGIYIKKTGRYKLIHLIGLGLMTVGQGLYILLGPSSSDAEWIIFQLITGIFGNMLLPAMLPAIQGELQEKDTAAAVAFWGFLRSSGIIWGVSIPAAIFNSRFDQLAYQIHDPSVRARFAFGHAYESASASLIKSLSGSTRTQVVDVYSESLKLTWEVAVALSGIAFLLVFLEREQLLRSTLETEYGLKKGKGKDATADPGAVDEDEKSERTRSAEGKGSESEATSAQPRELDAADEQC